MHSRIIRYIKIAVLLGNGVCLCGLAGCSEGGLSVTTVGNEQVLTEAEEETEPESIIAGTMITEAETQEEPAGEVLYIYVCGAVVKEGVYELEAGSRVYEAIDAAGGMTEDAAGAYINLAEPLTDGERIYVPTEEELDEGSISIMIRDSSSGESGSGLVNINTADAEQLKTLSGIGEKKAEDIISYRDSNGKFGSIEDIKNVSGIGDATFESIKDSITVD